MPPRRFILCPLLVALALLARPAVAGEIVGYDPANPTSHATYDRYTSGFPNAPVMNSSSAFVGAGLDLSGVGNRLGSNWGVTLVSPQHFVTANHVGLYAPGEQVRFLGGDGMLHAYTVAVDASGAVRQTRLTTTFSDAPGGPTRTLPSDILVVTLAAPIPVADGVRPLAVAANSAPNGTPLLAYTQNANYGSDTRQLGTNAVSARDLGSFDGGQSEATALIGYQFNRGRAGDVALTGGDSGGALLTRNGNTAILLGTHYGVDGDLSKPEQPYTSYSTDLSEYLGQLRSIVAADGQTLTVLPVPEPGSVGVVAAGALGALGAARRRAARGLAGGSGKVAGVEKQTGRPSARPAYQIGAS